MNRFSLGFIAVAVVYAVGISFWASWVQDTNEELDRAIERLEEENSALVEKLEKAYKDYEKEAIALQKNETEKREISRIIEKQKREAITKDEDDIIRDTSEFILNRLRSKEGNNSN